MSSSSDLGVCPVCSGTFAADILEEHVNLCLDGSVSGQLSLSAGDGLSKRIISGNAYSLYDDGIEVLASPRMKAVAAAIARATKSPSVAAFTAAAAAAAAHDEPHVAAAAISTAGTFAEAVAVPNGDDVSSSCVLCPFNCGQWVPLTELDSHEAAHRLQEQADLAMDLAAAAAAQGPSSPAGAGDSDAQLAAALQEASDFEALQMKHGFSDKRPGRCFRCGEEGHWDRECPKNPNNVSRRHMPLPAEAQAIATRQRREPQQPLAWPPESPEESCQLIRLLVQRLRENSQPGYEAYISGPVCHFSSDFDRGWGCGWRNMQMLASHLLCHPSFRQRLFNGSGFVPDIASLQAWLEVAWGAGYDAAGAEQLGHKVQGGRKWVGTTEAVALLRYFGIRARIVDFSSKANVQSAATSWCGVASHTGVACDLCGICPIPGARHRSTTLPNYDLCSECVTQPDAQAGVPYEEIARLNVGLDFLEQAIANGVPVHEGMVCHRCGCSPILGVRYCSKEDSSLSTCSVCCFEREDVANFERIPYPSAPAVTDESSPTGRHPNPASPQLHSNAMLAWLWTYFSGKHLPSAPMRTSCPDSEGDSPSPPPGPLHSLGHLSLGDAAAASPAKKKARQGDGAGQVFSSGMPPLYFQHEGHSRTIIGIERRTLPPHQRLGAASRDQHRSRSSFKSASLSHIGGQGQHQRLVQPSLFDMWEQSGDRSERVQSIADDLGGNYEHQVRDRLAGSEGAESSGGRFEEPGPDGLTGEEIHGLPDEVVARRSSGEASDSVPYMYTLLVLDPGIPRRKLMDALRCGQGWQRYLRRGLHTLRHSQYELVYIVPGEPSANERELSKVLMAAEVIRLNQSTDPAGPLW